MGSKLHRSVQRVTAGPDRKHESERRAHRPKDNHTPVVVDGGMSVQGPLSLSVPLAATTADAGRCALLYQPKWIDDGPPNKKGRTIVTLVSTTVHVQASDIPIKIETRGGVADRDIEHLGERLERVLRPVADRVVRVRALMTIHHEHDPGTQARVRVTLDAKGETMRSEVIAPTIREGISGVEDRLHRQIEQRVKQAKNDPRGKAPSPGEWRHGNRPSTRRTVFDRPIDEREIIARKSPTTLRSTLDEARWDRFVLGYDFFLFVDTHTGRDALLAPGEDNEEDTLTDIVDAPTRSVDEARRWLDETGRAFHFFRNEENERGAVIYHRYDGHYGLLTPRDLTAG